MERLWLCWAQIGREVWSEGRRAAHTICWPFDQTRLGRWEQIQPGRRRMGLDVDFETLVAVGDVETNLHKNTLE